VESDDIDDKAKACRLLEQMRLLMMQKIDTTSAEDVACRILNYERTSASMGKTSACLRAG
jgi:hypothetical protein